ncbi:uncharacterized protein LOC129317821 isoform X2 [Prosopis cineraria]|uniref:uncharacterized protein LOC129317821 isoform X2 n=1 Tax=Prosopis cineraria TaxID=364024 RepID=UPI00240F4F03|nr:uncharacterized protein LOC129317821 isoform X2 [Prosopis cineraria]
MAEVGVSVAAKLAEYLVDPTLQQLEYLFCVGKITKNVRIKKEKLMLTQERVQARVQEAINKTERIDGVVNKWMDDVQSLIADLENLEEKLKVNNGCFKRWCPIWRRYCLCKELAKITQRMVVLNTESGNLNPFSHPTIIPGIEYHSSPNFTFFNSTQRAFDDLLEALKDDGNSIVGLWGMGGSGKTTLVTEVGKEAKESKLFDRVVKITISQNLEIRKVQGEIADMFGLDLKEKSEIGRAQRIAERLQSGERILIILDDVWGKLNLEDIGILFGGNHQRNCKIVLTTRRKEVCTLMNCGNIIRLDILKEDEAWTLFQTHANVDAGAKEVVAREVAKECKGLPIAIVAVGTCLKAKGLDEMKVVLHKLKHSKPIDHEDKSVRDAFACLELSYSYLKSKEAKSLFLMCAMFPEDHKIVIEDLFRYGVGLDLCKDVDSFEIARSYVATAIEILVDSSLLMYSPNFRGERQLTMHDVVRDVALWIASNQDCAIKVNCTKELEEFLDDDVVKDCYAIGSWYHHKESLQFPSQLNAPKLEILLLHSTLSLDLSHASFEGAKGLKVVAIINKGYSLPSLMVKPQSIQQLSNLRTLRLRCWDLGDISFVVSLTRLEILDLQGSKFEKLPNGIEKLKKLKLLDLSKCKIDECCYEVLGSCLQLEELYVYPHSPHPKGKSCHDYTLAKLKRYKLDMGDHGYDVEFWNEGTQSLCLGKLNISILGEIIKDLVQRATSVYFYKLQGGCKTFIPNVVQAVGGMNELTKLHLECCSEIDCIIDETTLCNNVVVPKLDELKLKELKLKDMANLKQLCRGPSRLSLFQQLESLSISKCPQLLPVFLVSVARTLLSLKKLEIKECSELKNVLEGEEEQALRAQIETLIELPCLEHLLLQNLPNLVRICSERYHLRCPSIKEVVCQDCPNMEWQEFKGLHLRNEEYKPLAVIEKIDLHNCAVESNFFCQTGIEEHIPTFQYLKSLTLKRCARLKFVFSTHICQSLPMLDKVTMSECEELEAIFLGNEENEKNVSITEACLPKLSYLEIERCNKLKFVLSFVIKVATSMLPQLSTLTISNSSQLEEIFRCSNIEDHDIDNEMEVMFPNLKQVTLVKLPRLVNVRQWFKLQRGEFCLVYIHECPKFMPITSATIRRWTKERLKRKYVLKWSQLNNNEAHNLPLPVLNVGELDIQSPEVDDEVQVMGDDDQEETKDSEMLRSEQRMLGGLVPTQVLSFQYLHSLEMVRCKKLKFLFSIRTIVHNSLSNLSSLTLRDCEELEEIIQDNEEHQVMSNDQVHFPKLGQLKVQRCDKLIRLFPISMSTSFPQLHSLRVNGADQLEVIFGDSSEDAANYSGKIVLSSLREIELENLPNFINVCQGMQIQMQLSEIRIRNCAKFHDSSLGWALQQLGTISTGEFRKFEVHECPKFMPIMSATIRWFLGRLKRKYVLKWSQLNNNEAHNLPLPVLNVGELDIQSPEVDDEVQVMGDDDQEETKDSEMLRSEQRMLGGLVPTQVLSFQYLHSLEMVRCKKLKFLFSIRTIVHNSLSNLSSLTLRDCEELEEIIQDNEEHQVMSNDQVHFPKLGQLKVQRCDKLIRLFPISMSTSFPQLHSLRVNGADQLEVIFGDSSEDAANYSGKIVLSSLREIELENLPNFINVCQGMQIQMQLSEIRIRNCAKFHDSSLGWALQQLGTISTREFRKVEVHECPKFMPITSATIRRLKERLERKYALKWSQLNDNEALNLPLPILNVGELDIQSPEVNHEFQVMGDDYQEDDDQKETNDSKMLRSKEQMLGGLVPTQVLSFQYLHSLKMIKCKKLKFLFSISTIVHNSLPKLCSLSLSDCEELEVIFGHGGEDEANYSENIMLSSLKKMNLENLPNFISVCQGMQIQVQLSDIYIDNCPKFHDSSLKSALQQLGTISVSTENSKFQPIADVRKQLPVDEEKGMILTSRVESLDLIDSTNLVCVWEGPTFISFQNLETLKVKGCKKLKCIFSNTVVRSLPCLWRLYISECEELEEIMSSEPHFPNASSSSCCCFPKLEMLDVIKCRKLKWLFPYLPSTQHLPSLTYLNITQCSELEGVFSCEVEIQEEWFYNSLLPELVDLNVEDCPMFSETTYAAIKTSIRRHAYLIA